MKQRHLLLVALTLVLSLTISGCHKKDTNEETLIYPSFRFGVQQGESTIEYQAAVLFSEKVNELSKGTIDVKVFPNAILGDDIQMIDSLINGTLDFTYSEIGRLGLWVKDAEIFGYPYAFDDFNHFLRTLETDYGQDLLKRISEKNITLLATGYNGTRQTTSNTPIYSIDDMKDLRFRVPKAYANVQFAQLCGAKPQIVPFNEVYRQLKGNLIDAQENPLSTIYSNKFYEVQTCLALTSHILNDNNILMATSSFDLLTDWQQEAIKEAAKITEDFITENFTVAEKHVLKYLNDYGITITRPKRAPFKKAVIPLYEEYNKVYGDRAYKAIIKSQVE